MKVLLTGFLTLLLAGCTQIRDYTRTPEVLRSSKELLDKGYAPSVQACDYDPEEGGLGPPISTCSLSIVEFDEQGELWDPRQLTAALAEVDRLSNPERTALVVTFVHGWKNNASPRNSRSKNLASFRWALERLDRETQERCKLVPAYCGRPVVGVYMAWRGESLTVPWLKSLSIFSRRRAAEKVSRVSFSHALQRIASHAKGFKAETGSSGRPLRGNPDSMTVAVGHSLGAFVLENTILRSLTAETNNFRDDFPWDLTVLVNSANDSVLARQFVQALEEAPPVREKVNGKPLSLPIVVSLTSRWDRPTRVALPFLQALRGPFKMFRRYPDQTAHGFDQFYYFRHAPAHTKKTAGLISHQIDLCPESDPMCDEQEEIEEIERTAASSKRALAEQRSDDSATDPDPDPEPCPWLLEPPRVLSSPEACPGFNGHTSGLQCIQALWFRSATRATPYQLSPIDPGRNLTPYWILQTPQKIIPSHGRIFNSELMALISGLVSLRFAVPVASWEEAEEQFKEVAVTLENSLDCKAVVDSL